MDQKSRFSRRRFLTSIAVGAGLAPLTNLARGFARAPIPAAGLCARPSGGLGLLGPNDLTYLGSFKMPSDGVLNGTHPPYFFEFSDGAITGRRVGGRPTLLIQGPSIHVTNYADLPQLMEISIPEPSISNPPRAEMVQSWRNLYNQLDHKTGDTNQSIATGEPEIHGLGIDPDNPSHLWIGYRKYYSGAPDPCHFMVILNPNGTCTSYGPWRHGEGAYEVGHSSAADFGPMCVVPSSARASVGNKRFLSMGYEVSHRDTRSQPNGCNAHAWNPIDPGTARN